MGARTHGLTSDPLTHRVCHIWYDIRRRCYDNGYKKYSSYGGRGILLQPSWETCIETFVSDVLSIPGYDETKTLDRIDNDLGYIAGNLRWASRAEQVRNRRKPFTNTSGVCGVNWKVNSQGYTCARAHWSEGGVSKGKAFSVLRLGLLPAFAAACEYRAQMLNQLNEQGDGYSDKHGK